MLDFMLGRLNEFARIVMCGAISDYSKLLISASPSTRLSNKILIEPPHAFSIWQTRLSPTLSGTTKP
jgi:hypothetical protein